MLCRPTFSTVAGLLATGLLLGVAGCERPAPTPALRFHDVTVGSGLPATGKTSGAVLVDLDRDGRLDLLLGRHDAMPEAYRNDGDLIFTRLPGWGDGCPLFDHHATLVDDLDSDGRPDFYLVAGAHRGQDEGPNALLASSTDTDLAPPLGLTDPFGRGRGALLLDVDRDGSRELLVLNFKSALRVFALQPPWPARDVVDRIFGLPPTDEALLRGQPPEAWRRDDATHTLLPWDLDGDHRPEFLAFGGVASARLLRWRDGRLRFDPTTLEPAAYAPPPVAAVWLDLDGAPGLALVYGDDDRAFHEPTARRNRLLRWDGRRFGEVRGALPGDDGHGVAAIAADLDADGMVDLLVQQTDRGRNETRHRFLHRDDGESFVGAGAGVLGIAVFAGAGDGLVVHDLDGDGDLDVLALLGGVTEGAAGGGVRLLRNDLPPRAWLQVDLAPTVAGGADGARVEVEAASRRQKRQYWPVQIAGSAYHAPLFFGLGDAAVVTRLTVIWPDGRRTERSDLAVGQLVTVKQPD